MSEQDTTLTEDQIRAETTWGDEGGGSTEEGDSDGMDSGSTEEGDSDGTDSGASDSDGTDSDSDGSDS